MTASSQATAPRRAPRRTSPARAPRRRLAVVDQAPSRGRLVSVIGPIALFSLFGVLLLMAVFHALIVQGQRELDRLAQQTDLVGVENDLLRLELAEMEAPERVVAAARAFGMVDAPDVVYLSPDTARTGE